MIKKIKTLLFFCAIITIAISCEEWLDVRPKSEVEYSDLFSVKNGFKDQLTGVYTSMISEDLYGANLTYGAVDVLGQQYTWTHEIGRYYFLNRFEYNNSASKGIIDDIWRGLYSSVTNINILLKALDDFPEILSVDENEIFKGEALGLRAFIHFDLLRLFGDSYKSGKGKLSIPYVTSISKNVSPLLSVEDVTDQIIADLIKAESLLAKDPIKTGNPSSMFLGNRIFHFNYYAVKALLARVYLFKNDHQNALRCATEIIDTHKFKWINRDKVTASSRESRDGTFSTEGIFVLNNMKLDELSREYLREGANSNIGNLLKSSQNVINSLFEVDKFGGFDWRFIYFFESQSGQFLANTKLWQYRYNGIPEEFINRQPLIRISEMFLIAAESSLKTSDGVYFLNELRRNRGFELEHNFSTNISSDILTQEIQKEYRKEFIGEGQWFFYCKRMNLKDIPDNVVPFNVEYYKLPLPDQEIEYGNRNNN